MGVRRGEVVGGHTDVDRYLDRLLLKLDGSAGDVRRILAEVEEHVNEATGEGARVGTADVVMRGARSSSVTNRPSPRGSQSPAVLLRDADFETPLGP